MFHRHSIQKKDAVKRGERAQMDIDDATEIKQENQIQANDVQEMEEGEREKSPPRQKERSPPPPRMTSPPRKSSRSPPAVSTVFTVTATATTVAVFWTSVSLPKI